LNPWHTKNISTLSGREAGGLQGLTVENLQTMFKVTSLKKRTGRQENLLRISTSSDCCSPPAHSFATKVPDPEPVLARPIAEELP
jgi:hypothetical protein